MFNIYCRIMAEHNIDGGVHHTSNLFNLWNVYVSMFSDILPTRSGYSHSQMRIIDRIIAFSRQPIGFTALHMTFAIVPMKCKNNLNSRIKITLKCQINRFVVCQLRAPPALYGHPPHERTSFAMQSTFMCICVCVCEWNVHQMDSPLTFHKIHVTC